MEQNQNDPMGVTILTISTQDRVMSQLSLTCSAWYVTGS